MSQHLFEHSRSPHQRRHAPSGYTSYEGFKPWLRDEFHFRCVYCLEQEMWYPHRDASFSVDHIVPQSQDARLICQYTNLTYACTRCNSARREILVLDPTTVGLGVHLEVHDTGLFEARTREGQDLIDLLHLNENPALKVRRTYLRILALKAQYPENVEVDQLWQEAFGYPDDLPDLRRLRPPSGNGHKGSEQMCFYALREDGRIPSTY